MHLTLIAGARPNFMKIAPIIAAIQEAQNMGKNIVYRLVHTGQHFDHNMSTQFFNQLGIPEPDKNLEAGGGTQAEQTAAIMIGFEKDLVEHPTDLVIVVGDVTSTLACTIVAKKLQTFVAHVEGGIRSGDMNMPEEINRMVTDSISDYFFTTTELANTNLMQMGIDAKRIKFVGNTMIDTLMSNLPRLQQPAFWNEFDLKTNEYFVLTLHRPANVDDVETLALLLIEIIKCSRGLPVIFPVHPRTLKTLKESSISAPNLHIVAPMGYLEFNYLVREAKAVITDSGGISEEATVLQVPCMTMRQNTERPETVTMGTNELLGTDPENIAPAFNKLWRSEWKIGVSPPLWDGKAGKRIVAHLLDIYNGQ